MKHIITFAAVILATTSFAVAARAADAEKKSEDAPEAVALAWINGFLSGDVEKMMALADAPFAWDRKFLIKDRTELRAHFENLVKNMGNHNVRAEDAIVLKVDVSSDKLTASLPPDFITVFVRFSKDGGVVYLSPKPPHKVIGYSD
jgi:hypothetical protein